MSDLPADKDLILYDGVCGLCNSFVQFIIKRDQADRYRFIPLQSETAQALVRKHGGDPEKVQTIYLVHKAGTTEETAQCRGRAALSIILSLQGGWRLLTPLTWLPTFLIDTGYRVVAKLRYLIAGRSETCQIPTPETRVKFIDLP